MHVIFDTKSKKVSRVYLNKELLYHISRSYAITLLSFVRLLVSSAIVGSKLIIFFCVEEMFFMS